MKGRSIVLSNKVFCFFCAGKKLLFYRKMSKVFKWKKQGGEAVGQANRTDLSIYRRKYDERLRGKEGVVYFRKSDSRPVR